MIGSVLKVAALSGGAVIALALGLVLSDPPRPKVGARGMNFSHSMGRSPHTPQPVTVPMRDGHGLQVRDYPGTGPLVIKMDWAGWNGLKFHGPTPAPGAHVLVLDLRGHGAQPGRRGDVEYIGQFGDDLADLIALRIRDLNHLPVIGFEMPDVVFEGLLGDLAATRYSDRFYVSNALRSDHLRDVAAQAPFLLLTGAGDLAFVADGYAPLMSQATDNGQFIAAPTQSHLSFVDADATRAAITGFFDEL